MTGSTKLNEYRVLSRELNQFNLNKIQLKFPLKEMVKFPLNS